MGNFNYKDFVLETERLEIRPFLPEHLERALEYMMDRENTRLMTSLEGLTEDALEFDLNTSLSFWEQGNFAFCYLGVFLKSTGINIGNISFSFITGEENGITIGWVFDKAYHGQGYCTEAAKKVLDWVKENLGVEYVMATADYENFPSVAVMKKLGMTLEMEYDRFYKDGRKSIEVLYSMKEILDYYNQINMDLINESEFFKELDRLSEEEGKDITPELFAETFMKFLTNGSEVESETEI